MTTSDVLDTAALIGEIRETQWIEDTGIGPESLIESLQASAPLSWGLVKWQIDPGHGWLQVPLELLADKGLRESISGYSYMDSEYAYLEEDCDAGRFEDHWFGQQFYSSVWPKARGDYADRHVDRDFTSPRIKARYDASKVQRELTRANRPNRA